MTGAMSPPRLAERRCRCGFSVVYVLSRAVKLVNGAVRLALVVRAVRVTLSAAPCFSAIVACDRIWSSISLTYSKLSAWTGLSRAACHAG